MLPNTYLALREIMQSRTVRKSMDTVADRLATRLNAIIGQAGGAKVGGTVTRSDGTRPKGRPYAQVGLTAVRRLDAQGELAQAAGAPGAATSARLRVTARGPRA